MPKKLDGRKLAKEIEERLNIDIAAGLSRSVRPPGLAVIRVGNDPASGVYVANKEKACARIGVKSFGSHIQSNASRSELIDLIEDLNANENVDGILLQLPLPSGIDEVPILQAINPKKDADGLHALNLGKLLKGEKGPRSCTPAGVMALLARNDIEIEGQRAVVVGRSILVGKPMALMLQSRNATVTVAHSRTKNLEEITKQADLLVVAAGKPGIIGAQHVKSNAVVIDVGIHRVISNSFAGEPPAYSLCGDVRSEEVISKVRAITPVPGGVGPMTVSMLLVNTVTMWQEHCGLSTTLDDLCP